MLNKDHLEKLVRPYGIDATQLEFLQYSQNFVYKTHRDGMRNIVRICWGRHRREDQVAAELYWIGQLTDRGIRACQPIPSREGKLFHSIEIDGEPAIVVVFEHAPGNLVERKSADETTFQKLGNLTGSMHTAANAFTMGGERIHRPSWSESRLFIEDIDTFRHVLSNAFLDSVEDMIRRASATAATENSFGIIHGDINFMNVFEDQGDLWVFDFDNCQYGYFIQDLATTLWDTIYRKALNGFADDGLNHRIKPLWEALLKGYAETAPIKEIDLSLLKIFFLLREAIIFIHHHRMLDIPRMPEDFHRGLDVMRHNVEAQEHQVDFSLISKYQMHIKTAHTAPCDSA